MANPTDRRNNPSLSAIITTVQGWITAGWLSSTVTTVLGWISAGLTNTFITNSTSVTNSGWTPVADTWAYSSVDDPTGVLTVPSDATTKYSVGQRIKFTNGGNTVYGIITALSATTITFLHEINPGTNQALHLVANSAITAPYFSPHKAPFGFPTDPRKWMMWRGEATQQSQATPSASTWYNIGSLSISIPIGAWNISYQVHVAITKASGAVNIGATLSTTTNSDADADFRTWSVDDNNGGNSSISRTVFREGLRTVATKTPYYLLAETTVASAGTMYFDGTLSPTVIRAICAYL